MPELDSYEAALVSIHRYDGQDTEPCWTIASVMKLDGRWRRTQVYGPFPKDVSDMMIGKLSNELRWSSVSKLSMNEVTPKLAGFIRSSIQPIEWKQWNDGDERISVVVEA